jgi:hypothetical protein
MPANARRITRDDLVPTPVYARERTARRAALLPVKKLRKVALGPFCTFSFESFDTMLFQVQEMLLVEKGGENQIADELDAYNPLIPQGVELVATVMLEIEDPDRRASTLAKLGGIENRFYIQVGDDKVYGESGDDLERTREDGKTSSVHFLHFAFSDAQRRAFVDRRCAVMVGCDHPLYGHIAVVGEETRAELQKDFA